MKKWLSVTFFAIISLVKANAQFREATVLNGEFGIFAGAAHYFGDLNTAYGFNRPKITAGFMFRKQFGNYIAARVMGTFSQLGYSDVYSKNQVEIVRNLSFNSNVFEMALMGDFNFFRFLPGDREFKFTPYVSIGAGFMNYDPYAYLNGEKVFLRPLGTEGQGSPQYPDREPYGNMALVLPIGFGLKYNISPSTNLTFEVMHRFTSTDYLDDVSTTYAGPDVFPMQPNGQPSPAFLLQDRSYAVTPFPVGIAGRQRGNSLRKDQYITATIGITINLMSYKCPSY